MSNFNVRRLLELFREYRQMDMTIGLFVVVLYSANNVATIMSLIYLLVRKPYTKKVLNWLLLMCFADAITCLNWAYEAFFYRKDSMPQEVGALAFFSSYTYEYGNAASYNLMLFKCKTVNAVLYFPLFLSSISLSISCCCRWFTVAFPLKSKTVITNRRNNNLIVAAVLVSVAVTIADAYSYHLDSDDIRFNATDAIRSTCCKAYSVALCTPDGNSPRWIWDILRFVKPVTMFAVYFLCLLTSIGLAWSLFKARKNRSQMTGSGEQTNKSKAENEMKITAILAAMSGLQFLLGVPGDIIRLGVYAPQFEFTESGARTYLVSGIISNFFWDLTKANSLMNWIFHTGLQKNFYLFYLPCLRRRVSDQTSQLTTQSVYMTTMRPVTKE